MALTDLNALGIVLVILGGLIPALLWLWFWLKEDNVNPEPGWLIFLTFLLGVVSVAVVVPIQGFVQNAVGNDQTKMIVLAAAVEEIVKFGAVMIVAIRGSNLDEPIDFPIYFITVALGFAAIENALFLVNPVSVNDSTIALLTGNLRFLGSTLLHAIASATIGISMGLAFFKTKFIRKIYLLIGLAAAIALHSIFNFFIIADINISVLRTYAFLWVSAIIVMLVAEKLRRMSNYQ
jgi:RsiW-degrading membrane proteinase PrsW (M82 family)